MGERVTRVGVKGRQSEYVGTNKEIKILSIRQTSRCESTTRQAAGEIIESSSHLLCNKDHHLSLSYRVQWILSDRSYNGWFWGSGTGLVVTNTCGSTQQN